MSDDRPAVFVTRFGAEAWDDENEIVIAVTREEADVIRDVMARVAGSGSRADVARRLFEMLEGIIGYDCLADDGFEGEIVAPDGEMFGVAPDDWVRR